MERKAGIRVGVFGVHSLRDCLASGILIRFREILRVEEIG